jgi:hypothetical protein
VPCPVLDPIKIKGKGCPKGALGGAWILESSTKRLPSAFELQGKSPSIFEALPSTALAALPTRPAPSLLASKSISVQNRLSTTSLAMSRLQARHIDLYKPSTQRERGYMHRILSVFTDNCVDRAEMVSKAIEKDMHPIELEMLNQRTALTIESQQSQLTTIIVDPSNRYTQDAEFELDSQYIDLDVVEFS